MPQLSIIVPVYNKEKYIDACLESILKQTFNDFELILVNDGSTDGSALKCEHYKKTDGRIVLINQQNSGASAARNTGLKEAKGTYIGFIDSDDTIEADMYELLIKNARAFDADISVCRLQIIFPEKTLSPPESEEVLLLNQNEALFACLKGDLDRSANNKIYKNQIAKSILFEGNVYEDILYTCKAFLTAQRTVVQHILKYNYIVRENSISMSRFNKKYIETISVSAQITEIVAKSSKKSLDAAQAFDVTANISLLNLLLLAGKENYLETYTKVTNTLNRYSAFIKNSDLVRKKHKYAFSLFSASPRLYAWLMYRYCKLTDSEAVKRV